MNILNNNFIFYFDEDYGMQEDLPDSGTTQSNHLAVIENHKKVNIFRTEKLLILSH